MPAPDPRNGVPLTILNDVEMLSSRVIRVLGGNPGKFTLQGTNTYIIGTGNQRLLIDTGEGKLEWINSLQRVLQKEEITITKAIITHWHHDHQGGIKQLLEVSPDTEVYKNTPDDTQKPIEDQQKFTVEGASLQAVYPPGHTKDHMSFILEEEDAMFTGDNVLGFGTAVFEDLATYLDSLDKMRTMFHGRAYPGHGPVIEDGPSKVLEYLNHRKSREDQVMEVLRSSRPGVQPEDAAIDQWSSMEIVRIIYRDVPENLYLAANGGVVQILHKLKAEDKVAEDSTTDSWSIRKRSAL